MSFPKNELIFNKAHNGMLTQEKNSAAGNIAFFKGGVAAPEKLEANKYEANIDAVDSEKTYCHGKQHIRKTKLLRKKINISNRFINLKSLGKKVFFI